MKIKYILLVWGITASQATFASNIFSAEGLVVSKSAHNIRLSPDTTQGSDTSSLTIAGAKSSLLEGGSISVYGNESSSGDGTYGGDVRIYAGGNPISGFGQVWLGVTVDDPVLGVVPQDVLGIQNDGSVDFYTSNGVRFRTSINSTENSNVITIGEKDNYPAINFANANSEFFSIGINDAGEAMFTGELNAFVFDAEVHIESDLIVDGSISADSITIALGEGIPASSSESCNSIGELRASDEYLYICVGEGSWRRMGLETW